MTRWEERVGSGPGPNPSPAPRRSGLFKPRPGARRPPPPAPTPAPEPAPRAGAQPAAVESGFAARGGGGELKAALQRRGLGRAGPGGGRRGGLVLGAALGSGTWRPDANPRGAQQSADCGLPNCCVVSTPLLFLG